MPSLPFAFCYNQKREAWSHGSHGKTEEKAREAARCCPAHLGFLRLGPGSKEVAHEPCHFLGGITG